MSTTLKEYIEKLISLENQELKYKTEMNNIKKEKENISNSILNYMEKNNITNKEIIYGNNKIKYSSTKIQDNITKKLIFERLKIFLKNENLATEATNFIYSDRNNSIKKSLKISNNKST
jgi:seryl-tRNA synthetase